MSPKGKLIVMMAGSAALLILWIVLALLLGFDNPGPEPRP